MRYFYSILLVLPLWLSAQTGRPPVYWQVAAGSHTWYLSQRIEYKILELDGTSLSRQISRYSNGLRGGTLATGLTYAFSPRWQTQWSTAYARGSVRDTLAVFIQDANGLPVDLSIYDRVKAWGLWTELRVFYLLNRSYSTKFLVGLGTSYGFFRQTYRSGFEYDASRQLFIVQRST